MEHRIAHYRGGHYLESENHDPGRCPGEAGVSVATVSYVINNRTDMRISDATRKKVLQVINLLDYTPNQSAKALATSRNRMAALYLDTDVPGS